MTGHETERIPPPPEAKSSPDGGGARYDEGSLRFAQAPPSSPSAPAVADVRGPSCDPAGSQAGAILDRARSRTERTDVDDARTSGRSAGARRPAGAVPRRRRTTVRWTDDEWAAIERAAAAVGLKPAAYVAAATEAAVEGTEGPRPDPAREAVGELLATRTQLVRVGTNLNQAVHRFHSTGDAPPWLEDTVDEVSEAVARVDEVTAAAGAALRQRRRR